MPSVEKLFCFHALFTLSALSQAMKLVVLFTILSFFSSIEMRTVLKCGYVSLACVPKLNNDKCPEHTLCPKGFTRKLDGDSCCCFLRDSVSPVAVPPGKFIDSYIYK